MEVDIGVESGVIDEAKIVREVTSIMRIIQSLLQVYLCSLSVLLEEFSENPELAVNHETQRMSDPNLTYY